MENIGMHLMILLACTVPLSCFSPCFISLLHNCLSSLYLCALWALSLFLFFCFLCVLAVSSLTPLFCVSLSLPHCTLSLHCLLPFPPLSSLCLFTLTHTYKHTHSCTHLPESQIRALYLSLGISLCLPFIRFPSGLSADTMIFHMPNLHCLHLIYLQLSYGYRTFVFLSFHGVLCIFPRSHIPASTRCFLSSLP